MRAGEDTCSSSARARSDFDPLSQSGLCFRAQARIARLLSGICCSNATNRPMWLERQRLPHRLRLHRLVSPGHGFCLAVANLMTLFAMHVCKPAVDYLPETLATIGHALHTEKADRCAYIFELLCLRLRFTLHTFSGRVMMSVRSSESCVVLA